MAFPGQVPDKRKSSYRLYGYVLGAVGLLVWVVVVAIKDVRGPLPPVDKAAVHVVTQQQPGLVTKTADRFGDDIHQILRGDPLKRAPERTYRSRSVVYGNQTSAGGRTSTSYYEDR